MKYMLLEDRFSHTKGTVVYLSQKYDYGIASDDWRQTGQQHVSVTLKEEGGYPFFSCPLSNLKEIK